MKVSSSSTQVRLAAALMEEVLAQDGYQPPDAALTVEEMQQLRAAPPRRLAPQPKERPRDSWRAMNRRRGSCTAEGGSGRSNASFRTPWQSERPSRSPHRLGPGRCGQEVRLRPGADRGGVLDEGCVGAVDQEDMSEPRYRVFRQARASEPCVASLMSASSRV